MFYRNYRYSFIWFYDSRKSNAIFNWWSFWDAEKWAVFKCCCSKRFKNYLRCRKTNSRYRSCRLLRRLPSKKVNRSSLTKAAWCPNKRTKPFKPQHQIPALLVAQHLMFIRQSKTLQSTGSPSWLQTPNKPSKPTYRRLNKTDKQPSSMFYQLRSLTSSRGKRTQFTNLTPNMAASSK